MKKEKKLIKIVIALIIAFMAIYAIKTIINRKTNTDSKNIELTIMVEDEIIYSANIATDRAYLGDLIDDLNDTHTVSFELSGSKNSAMGRMIMGINEYVSDSTIGPWWMIYSDTNKDALTQGYCNGIDTQTIYDQDVFYLKFEN